MYTLIILIAILAALLMVLVVVVQNSKGGGLTSTFGASSVASQMMGTRRTTDVVEKITWYLFGIIVFLTFVANFALPPANDGDAAATRSSKLEKGIEGLNLQDVPAPGMGQPGSTDQQQPAQ
ncbi:MAG: preprotein translocase subunit SecG [Sphingobacteriia bacterium]|jgi:preprotein translocase subunit SecG|nr:preprotein translocase subunit SecG [Sphingobacteriia bacterium]